MVNWELRFLPNVNASKIEINELSSVIEVVLLIASFVVLTIFLQSLCDDVPQIACADEKIIFTIE